MKKGISLIVLIITIIVMIIIAGAVIISLSDTNIIEQSEYAAEAYRVSMYEEKINLARQEKLLAEYGTTEGVNISVRAVLNITEENEEEYVVNIATANSIPANMPAGTYYKLDENKYATRTRENEREIVLASRGIDRENELVTNTYVVNDNFDVYYIISGTIGEPETEDIEWKYAWTSDGNTWSDIIKAEELADGAKVEGKIVAKIYETDEVIEEVVIEDEGVEGTYVAGKGYVLDIQGEGEIPAVQTEETVITSKGEEETEITSLVWLKEIENYWSEETTDAIMPYITKITIGEGITNIPDYMFYGFCASLKELNIPSTVKTIGEEAFSHCNNLSKLVIPNGVEKIDSYAFTYCKKLVDVTIGNNVTEIGKSAFSYCENLTRIVIPASVAKINKGAFEDCYSLKEIYIERTINELYAGSDAFGYIADNSTIYVRSEAIANLISGSYRGYQTTISTDYNWTAPTN